MYISAAEFGLIIDALKYAAERVEESCGEIQPFGADDNDGALADAEAARDLAKRLEAADVYAKDWALIAEEYDNNGGTWYACLNLINEMYYDDYGRLRKARYAVPTIDAWIAETKRTHTVGLDIFPAEAIEQAHDFLGDLWLDNERAGDNNPDGTFNTRK